MIINPEWIAAGAEAALAVETGVAMLGNKKPDQIPALVPVARVGTSGCDLTGAALIVAGAILVLAAAMLASAAILHHGLALAA